MSIIIRFVQHFHKVISCENCQKMWKNNSRHKYLEEPDFDGEIDIFAILSLVSWYVISTTIQKSFRKKKFVSEMEIRSMCLSNT